MINLSVYCHPTFIFDSGNVTGYIEIAPRALIDAAVMELYAVSYDSPEANSIRLLILAEESKIAYPDSKMICITSGVVSNDFVKITLHDAINLIGNYIHIEDLLNDDSLSSDMKLYVKDFLDVRDYIYRCNDCNCLADTANINFK